MIRNAPVLATLAVFALGFGVCAARFHHFASTRVAANLLTDSGYLGVMAVGMTFVIVSGGIDLSVGAVLGFTTVLLAVLVGTLHVPALAAFLIALVVAGAFGAAQGAVIHALGMPPFIVTLAGMFLARGTAFLLSTRSVPIDAPFFAHAGAAAIHLPGGGRLGPVALAMLAVFAAGIVVLHFTRFGAATYALGGSRVSTALMGLRVGRLTIAIYALSGGLAGVGGIVFAIYTQSGYALSGLGSELDTIAAVVIGGTLLQGGYGTLAGTFVGVLIEGLIQTYIEFDGTLSSWWAKIATGFLLFAFIALQQGVLGTVRRRVPAGAAGT